MELGLVFRCFGQLEYSLLSLIYYLVALDWDLDLGWSTSGRGGKWGRMKGFGLQPGPRGRSDQKNFVILTNVNTNTNKII